MKLKKLKNLKFSFMSIVAFMAIMLITGCGDETTVGEKTGGTGNSATQLAGYYDIVGTVVNDADDPIQHVFIDIIDFVMTDGGTEPFVASVRSDGNGEFGIRIPGENAIRQVTLRFTFQDCVTYAQDVMVTKNGEVDLENITLTVMSQKTIEDSTIENTLVDNVRTNAYVTIGADALRYSDGTTFTTDTVVAEDEDPVTATVAIGYVDTTSNPGLFPDNLYSMVNGSLKLFSTYGILEIKVTTDGGNTKLSLGSGQTAAISIPVGDLVNVNDPDFPATVDLWYYDEDAAEWVLEQEDGLTYDAGTRSFIGVVNHFSTFNAGYTFESRYAQASVMDDRGMMCPSEEYDEEDQCTVDEVPYLLPLPGSTLKVFTETFSPYGVWNATYTAGSDGKIPDSMNPSIAGLLYNDADGYFFPVPGTGNLMAFLEYTNPTTSNKGSVGPDLIEFEGNKVSHDYLLALSTQAYITATVTFANGEPAHGVAIMINDPVSGGSYTGGVVDEEGVLREATFSFANYLWTPVTNGSDQLPVAPNNDTYIIVPRNSSTGPNLMTPIKELRLDNASGPLVEDVFSLADSRFSSLAAGTYGPWTDYNSLVLSSGTPAIGGIQNLVIILKDPATDVRYTHLNGAIALQDLPSGVDPENLWVVIRGSYDDRPIVVRGSVDEDGNWPADDGRFSPVTVDGVEGLFLKVPSETDLTITVGDYVTDPLDPVIYYSYDYTSDIDAIRDEDGNITEYITNSITPGKNAYIEGKVTYNAWLGSDLRVVFTKENAGADDKPVTVTTDASGSFSAKLEFKTDYIVRIWDDTDELFPVDIWASNYTSNPDGEVGHITYPAGVAEGLIQIGDEYFPIATVSGMVVYDGVIGEDLLVTFTPTAGDPVSAISDEEGIYSADLVPDTDYTVTVSEHDGGIATTLLYPSDAFPVDQDAYDADGTIGELLFTSSDIDSNVAGDEDELDIQIGAPLPGDEVPAIPADKAGIKGTVENADGTYPVGQWCKLTLADGTYVSYPRIGEDGKIFATAMGQYTDEFLALTPDTDYILNTTNFATDTPILAFTTPASGIVETVKIVLPAEGEEPTNSAYVKGIVANADGTYPVGQWCKLTLADGTYVSYPRIGEDGKIFATAMGQYTDEFLTLSPNTEYILNTTNFATDTPILTFTTPDTGFMGTGKIILPAEGEDPTDSAYVRGTVANADGTYPVGQWCKLTLADGTYVSYPRIGEDGKIFATAMGQYTDEFLTLSPNTEYILNTTNFATDTPILTFTTSDTGAVISVGYIIPAP